MLAEGKEAVVEPPIQFKLLQIARDMGVSYAEVLRLDKEILLTYTEMRDIEDQVKKAHQQQAPDVA